MAFVPHRREVLHRMADPVCIIDANIADAGRLWTDINENERQIPKSQMF